MPHLLGFVISVLLREMRYTSFAGKFQAFIFIRPRSFRGTTPVWTRGNRNGYGPAVSFNPRMPATISPTKKNRPNVAGSPKTRMPRTKVPTAPIPVHTA